MAVSQGHRLRMKFVNFLATRAIITIQFADIIHFILHRMSCCTGCHVAPEVMLHTWRVLEDSNGGW